MEGAPATTSRAKPLLRLRSSGSALLWRLAARLCEFALAPDDRRVEWYLRLGHAREKARQWPLAALAYEAAVARDDSQVEWYLRLGHARENSKQGRAARLAYQN